MALVLIEGFDYYTSAAISSLGWTYSGGGGDLSMVSGRFGGQAINQNSSGGGGQAMVRTLPSTYATLILGVAISSSTALAIRLQTSASATVATIIRSGNNLAVLNAAGSTVATGTANVGSGYHYAELKIFVNGASGTCELHVDGATDIASTTGNFGSTNINKIQMGFTAGGAGYTFDDIYCLDTSGSTNTTFLGDSRIVTIRPNAAGAHTQWTPLSGANYTQVNETTPDGDSSYNYDQVVGNIDSFPTGGIDAASTVFGVQTHLYARKDSTGTRQIADLIRQAGTDYVGATDTLSTSYQFFNNLYNQDPTSSNWTAAHINADEYGYKLIA